MRQVITRDPDLARRLGFSPGFVREVERLAARIGESQRLNPLGSRNPWLRSQPTWEPRAGTYAEAMIRLANASSRSQPPINMGNINAVIELTINAYLRYSILNTAFDVALAAREIYAAMQAATSVNQGLLAGPEVPEGWIFNENWEQACGGAAGSWFATTMAGCGGDMQSPPSWLVTTSSVVAASGVFPGLTAQHWTDNGPVPGVPGWNEYAQGQKWNYVGPTMGPGPGADAELPEYVPAQPGVPLPGVSLTGLPDWTPLARAAQQAGSLMLPNLALPNASLSGAQIEAAHAVREALGLREEFLGIPLPVVKPAPSPALVGGWTFDLPAISVETDGKRWIQHEAHVFTRPAGGRQKKLRVMPGVAAYKVLAGAFTETNDFIEAIWSTLPRSRRRAGLTKTGNRRTDSMLRDIYRGWEHIDWSRALGNVLSNELEDRMIGRQQRVMNALTQTSGQGQGTHWQRAHEGVDTNWTDGITSALGDAVAGTAYAHGFGMHMGGLVRRGREALLNANTDVRLFRERTIRRIRNGV